MSPRVFLTTLFLICCAGLTRAAAVVLTPKSNARLKHIEFVRLEPEKALVILVG